MKKLVIMLVTALFFMSCTLDLNPQDGRDGIAGINGVDGLNGVSVVSIIPSNCFNEEIIRFVVTYSDGSISFIDIPRPHDGHDGIDGQDGINGTNGVDGKDAVIGVYIVDIEVIGEELIEVTYSDGTSVVLDYDDYDDDDDYNRCSGEWIPNRGYIKGSIVEYKGSHWRAKWTNYTSPHDPENAWTKLRD